MVFHFFIFLIKIIQGEQLEGTPCNLYKYKSKKPFEAYTLDCSHCGLTELPEIKRETDDILKM